MNEKFNCAHLGRGRDTVINFRVPKIEEFNDFWVIISLSETLLCEVTYVGDYVQWNRQKRCWWGNRLATTILTLPATFLYSNKTKKRKLCSSISKSYRIRWTHPRINGFIWTEKRKFQPVRTQNFRKKIYNFSWRTVFLCRNLVFRAETLFEEYRMTCRIHEWFVFRLSESKHCLIFLRGQQLKSSVHQIFTGSQRSAQGHSLRTTGSLTAIDHKI